jgi:hypothetical protein
MNHLRAFSQADLDRVQWWSLGVGALAVVICLIGAIFDVEQFFQAYLSAYLFYLGIALGCLAILMCFHLTGGAWGFLIRRFLEAATRTLPLLALLFVPIACAVSLLFRWARPEEVAADPKLQWKHVYLNVPFWWARAALFFGFWIVLAILLTAWSRRQEEPGNQILTERLTRWSGIGLVIHGICMHFASIDWIMSLQPEFKSSIFGPLVVSAQAVSAMAFVLVVAAWFVIRPPLREFLSTGVLNDLGTLLFTFVVIWAYMVFFQFMLIWIANLPFEVVWYVDRWHGAWQAVGWLVFVLGLVVPFFGLLQRRVKRDPIRLGYIAGLVLFSQLLFGNYQILPAFQAAGFGRHWMNFIMPLGLGGIWFAFFLWQLKQQSLVGPLDANRVHALYLHEEDLEEEAREAAVIHG